LLPDHDHGSARISVFPLPSVTDDTVTDDTKSKRAGNHQSLNLFLVVEFARGVVKPFYRFRFRGQQKARHLHRRFENPSNTAGAPPS
jgi:hypothetical protein